MLNKLVIKMEESMGDKPVVIEQSLNLSTGQIWNAITDKDEMKQWYFHLKEFKPEVGFEFRFLAGENEDKQYLHICKITEVIPGKKIAYSWRYEGYEGISYVSFELFSEMRGTRLKLTHSGLESFPQNNPDLAKGNFEKGWKQIIGGSLKNYLG
jgi:uncharacterized protein YndB with AHSA1/START domain